MATGMRIGVLDVGSHGAHLRVVQARPGGSPTPVHQLKVPLRLHEQVETDGRITEDGIIQLVAAVQSTTDAARAYDVSELIPIATAVLRDAPNHGEVCRRVREACGITLGFLSGPDDARLTFLAAHRWHGWSRGPLLVVDIGGGSTEIAYGYEESPVVAASLPLGVRRLTDERLPEHPADHGEVAALRSHVAAVLTPLLDHSGWPEPTSGPGYHAVGTSKTFKQLARLSGEGRGSDPVHPTVGELGRVSVHALRDWIPRLADMSPAQRGRLRGVSASRARHILAGAVVAEAVMSTFELDHIDVCPWALREGVLLRRLEPVADPTRRTSSAGAEVPFAVINLADRQHSTGRDLRRR